MAEENVTLDKSFVERNAFGVSFGIMLTFFWFAHFTLSRAYQGGIYKNLDIDVRLYTTIGIGVLYSIATIVFLIAGIRAKNPFWQNMYGLCGGLTWWLVYGEVGDTLRETFKWDTGIGIGHGNFPFLFLLGTIFIIALYKKAIKNDTILQWANFAYMNWFGHVILLTLYYAPIFGGKTPKLGTTVDCWDEWSSARIIGAFVIWGIYILIVSPIVILKLRKSEDIRVRVACGFWGVLLFWSIFVEIPKKLVYTKLW